MTTTLTVFTFEDYEIRFVGTAGDPWWVAADVCSVLDIKNPSQVIARLDDDDRAMLNIGIKLDAWCVNESGLYALILGSRKLQAKKFKKWLTSEVLPAIRKNGRYEIPCAVQVSDSENPTFDLSTISQISELFDVILTGLDADVVADIKLKTIARYYPRLEVATKMASAVLRGHPLDVFYTIAELTDLLEEFAEIILALIKNRQISAHEKYRPEAKRGAEIKLAELIAADVNTIRNSETLQELLDVAIDVTQFIPTVVVPGSGFTESED